MKKRRINKKDFRFLEEEATILRKEGIISSDQQKSILDFYEVQSGLSFIRVLLTIGALLLGIGVLSFIASNWDSIGKGLKLLLIIVSIYGCNLAGIKLQGNYPKTSRSLHYVAILIYGAGIFLVEQMFNLNSAFQTSFLLWAAGSVFIGFHLKDTIILIFTTLLLFVYTNAEIWAFKDLPLPYFTVLFLPVLYIALKRINYRRTYTFFLNGLLLNTVCLFLFKALETFRSLDDVLVEIIMFAIGIAMIYIPVADKMRDVTRFQGNLLHGLAALFLTFDVSIFIVLLYFVYLLYLVKKGNLFSIVTICALILRYYIDYSFDFLPKSFAFIIGGLILIGFGFFFEKQRKKGGKNHEIYQ